MTQLTAKKPSVIPLLILSPRHALSTKPTYWIVIFFNIIHIISNWLDRSLYTDMTLDSKKQFEPDIINHDVNFERKLDEITEGKQAIGLYARRLL